MVFDKNITRVTDKRLPEHIFSTMIKTGTSQLDIPLKKFNKYRNINLVAKGYYQAQQDLSHDKLIAIEDVIASYTSTKDGKKEWDKAVKEHQKELFLKMKYGKLNKVKYYRLINKMDQNKLASLSGIKQPNISRIEKLGYEADTKTYKIIALIFKINYKELLP